MASFEGIEVRAHQLDDLKVRALMGTPPITITSDTPIVKAGSLMILRGIKQLPVVDNDRLSGIITLTDIITILWIISFKKDGEWARHNSRSNV